MSRRIQQFLKSLRRSRKAPRRSARILQFERFELRLPLWAPWDANTLPFLDSVSTLAPDITGSPHTLTPVAEGESNPAAASFIVPLRGNAPHDFQIIDPRTGEMIVSGETILPQINVSTLAPGDYLLRYTTPQGSGHSIRLLVNVDGVTIGSTNLQLEGTSPRRVRIRDTSTGSPVWDNWIYGTSFDVVGILPDGDYQLEHAASGENWHAGMLRIGANVPSYRVYSELRDDGSLLVDWGQLGSQPAARIVVSQSQQIVVDEQSTDSRMLVPVAAGVVDIAIELQDGTTTTWSVGTPVPSVSKITLPFRLPGSVSLIDTADGQMVSQQEVTQPELELEFLATGDYLLVYDGELSSGSLIVTKTDAGVQASSAALNLDGAVPRRVQITDATREVVVWDNWIYGNKLDVVAFLAAGEYRVKHAASGESWQEGSLRIGAAVPSFRLYTELRADNTLLIDWGTNGEYPPTHLLIQQQDTVVVDGEWIGPRMLATIPAGVVDITVSLPGKPDNHLRIETPLPVRARSPLTLDGALPRRLRVMDGATGAVVSDYWIYETTVPIANLLPAGEYSIQHAASGENWRTAVLQVGSSLPSGRLYAELQPDQNLLLDWGSPGWDASAHIRVIQAAVPVVELDVPGEGAWIMVPEGAITVEVMLGSDAAAVLQLGQSPGGSPSSSPAPGTAGSFQVPLTGNLPRTVRVTDTATGVVVFEQEVADAWLDMRLFPSGDYLVQHAGAGEPYRSLSVLLDESGVIVGSPQLNLDGPLPRRVRIRDTSDDQFVFDHWIYGSRIAVLDILPEGQYVVEHAASGENWRLGTLHVGEFIPSYRLYSERIGASQVRVNWGFVGGYDHVRVRGFQSSNLFYDATHSGEEAILEAPEGVLDFQVILNEQPPVPAVVRTLELSGTLPRQVRIFDPVTQATVAESLQTSRLLDLSFLPIGNYIVEHSAAGSVPRYIVVANGQSAFETYDPGVTFTGALPRRVVFTDTATQQVVWDNWIYGSSLNVLGILPVGEYFVQHAASGESWRSGELIVGAPLQSFRLYVEHVSPELVKVDWGPISSESSARVMIYQHSELVVDLTQEESQVIADVPQGELLVTVSSGRGYEQSLQYCSLPQLAPDGSCRSFAESRSLNVIAEAMISFIVPGAIPSDPALSAQVVIEQPPQFGTLVPGDRDAYQTYLPNPGYVGADSAVLRVVYSDGSERSVFVFVNVAAAASPKRAYFVPGIGTTQPDYRTPPPSQLVGGNLPFDVIVSSDFGQVVERINRDGATVWRNVQVSPTSAVAVLNDEVFVAGYRSIRILNAATGILKRTIVVDLAPMDVLQFANPLGDSRYLVSWFTSSNVSHVGIWNDGQGWEWISAQTYLWPRWADLRGDMVVVADTFGHRVVAESVTTGANLFQIPAYFPNDVRFLNDLEILITEEHADRVWTYNWSTADRSLVISAPGKRSDLQLPFETVVSMSDSADLRIDPLSRVSPSKSSMEYSGIDTVYAPNSAIQLPDGTYYIADTDNQRVIQVGADGLVLTQLVGINNPTKVALVFDTQ